MTRYSLSCNHPSHLLLPLVIVSTSAEENGE